MELDLGEVLLGGRAARHRALDPTQPLRAERVCRRRRIGLQEEEGRVVRFYLTLILTLTLSLALSLSLSLSLSLTLTLSRWSSRSCPAGGKGRARTAC